MIDTSFRKMLPNYTVPLIHIYKFLNLSPNFISILGLLLGLGSAYLISCHEFSWAIVIWWVGRLMDGTDGIYARAIGKTSSFGAYLDISCDMAAYSAIIVAFDFAFPVYHLNWNLILFLYILCITGALSLGNLEHKSQKSELDNRGLRLAAGFAEGGETGIAYTLFLLFPTWIGILSNLWILVLSMTVLSRVMLAEREFKS